MFFPTEKETKLGFLIQGPYRTTPARDNVPPMDEWNRHLIQETAALIVDTLPYLRDAGLLTVGLLQVLPISRREFAPGTMFHPLFERVRSVLMEQNLLPTHNGTYVPATQARLARGAGLRQLLLDSQLQDLLQTPSPLYWLPDEITADRTPELRTYLRDELKIDEITAEGFVTALHGSFMQLQSDQWVGSLYAFLLDQRALWNPRPGYLGLVQNKEIIRIQNGTHVLPFDRDKKPNAYLPTPNGSDFPTVIPQVLENPSAIKFLRQLGLIEPDLLAELRLFLVPRYSSGVSISEDQHRNDMLKIIRAIKTGSQTGKAEVIKLLQDTPFVLAEDLTTGKCKYCKPTTVYLPSAPLRCYFHYHSSAWFLAEESNLRDLLSDPEWEELGLASHPRLASFDPQLSYQRRRELRGDQGYTRDLERVDYELDGLSEALTWIHAYDVIAAEAVAVLIWDTMLHQLAVNPRYDPEYGFNGTYQWQYYSSRSATFPARWVNLLKDHRWLPQVSGSLQKPGDVVYDDLPASFRRDARLESILGLGISATAASAKVQALALEVGVSVEGLEFLRDHPEVIQEVRRQLARDAKAQSAASSPASFGENLRETFSRAGQSPLEAERVVAGGLPNPERRRERLSEEIAAAQATEPAPSERFTRGLQRVWEARNEEVRVFLAEEYQGRCQICGQGFAKRDSSPYFESIRLVGYVEARWSDRAGSAVCLCPTCAAKIQHGTVVADDIEQQILAIRVRNEGGNGDMALALGLCGDAVTITYSERHIMDLQEMLKSSLAASNGTAQATGIDNG